MGAEVVIDGRRYINFAGSSYLGLSRNRALIEAGVSALRESGGGYQFPRETHTATRAHLEAESAAAAYFETESALYLAGGYYFGLVALAEMRDRFDKIFYDEWAHYSLREAIAASGLAHIAYRHLEADDLGEKLKAHLGPKQRPLIVTDGMYATYGEIAPLDQIFTIAAPYDGYLLVDESHSFGVLGRLGRGACEHHDVPPSRACIGGSTSKALSAVGGIIPSSEQQVALFRLTPAGRGAASGLPAAASMCAASFKYVRDHPELLERLRTNVVQLKTGLRKIGVNVADSVAPVASFTTGSAESMRLLQERLRSEGLFVMHTTYIGATHGGVIRCGIFADHTQEHIDRLVDALGRLL